MEKELFDRDTLLDLTVNFIPLGILLLFIVIYLVFNPFGFGGLVSVIQFSIIGIMFIALAVLTYYSGAAVSRAENQAEADAALEGEGETEPGALAGAADTDESEREPAAELAGGEAPEDGPDDGRAAENNSEGEMTADTDDGTDSTA
jgi:hypothetical protein